jgi:DNA-directed RNA polymerase subunit E'/Rpb7
MVSKARKSGSSGVNSLATRSICRETVRLRPHQIGPDYMTTITRLLRSRLEGRCSKHGYILKDTIEVQPVSLGRAEQAWLNGDFAFVVTFAADTCDVTPGVVVQARVVNVNRFGILAEAGAVPSTDPSRGPVPFLDIVIVKEYVGIQSEVPLDTLAVNDLVYAEIIGRRLELDDERVTAVARVLRDSVPATTMTLLPSTLDAAAERPPVTEDDPEAAATVGDSGSDEDDDIIGDAAGDADILGDADDLESVAPAASEVPDELLPEGDDAVDDYPSDVADDVAIASDDDTD